MFCRQAESQSLELVAVALSEEYGIRVVCGGRRAETICLPNGRPLIRIPSVHCEDPNYLSLLRGYIDHEVGHVRFTDRDAIDQTLRENLGIIGALETVFSMYEDLYVEGMMGACFPGCRRNLRKLVSLVFAEKRQAALPARDILQGLAMGTVPAHDLPYQAWAATTQYILYRVRSESSPELARLLPEYREAAEWLAPGLAEGLEPVLARVQTEGTSTRANMALARETLGVADAFFQKHWRLDKNAAMPAGLRDLIRWVLRNGGRAADRVDVAKSAAHMVEEILKNVDEVRLEGNVTIRHAYGGPVWQERLGPLSDPEQLEALQAAAMLAAQMQSLLQTFVLNREGPCRIGRLNTNALYKLYTCDTKLFHKNVEQRHLNTEIVIAVDMSGSMHLNDKDLMASKALYAVVHCLRRIRGLLLQVIGFFDNNIVEILRRHDRVSPRIRILANGGTLCGNAVQYAMQQFTGSRSSRKIIMMITDGDANDTGEFHDAIVRAKQAGLEFLGLGILDEHITRYLDEEECCVIEDLRRLAPEIFRMLRARLCGGTGRNAAGTNKFRT